MRGRSVVVEKMGNKAMNCLVQGNKWKLALGRGGGAAAVHCTRSGNNILSPPWALIAAGFLSASAIRAIRVQGMRTPFKNLFDVHLSLTNYAMKFVF
jgi:hypothetical protein